MASQDAPLPPTIILNEDCFLTTELFPLHDSAIFIACNDDEIPTKSNAKILKIDSTQTFVSFIENVTLNFPNVSVFIIYGNSDENAATLIKEGLANKFDDRSIVLELRRGETSKIYVKKKGQNFQGDGEIKWFLNDIRDGKISSEQLVDKTIKSKNLLILDLLKVFQLEKELNFKVCESLIRLSNDKETFYKTLEIPCDEHGPMPRQIPQKAKDLLSYVSDSGSSILKTCILLKRDDLILFILDNFNYYAAWDFNYRKILSGLVHDYPNDSKELFPLMIQRNFPYPDNYNEDKFTECENTILKDQKELHDAFDRGEEELTSLINKIYESRVRKCFSSICFNNRNEPLLKRAFERHNNTFKLYVLLKVHGFIDDPFTPTIKESIEALSDEQKEIINVETLSLSLGHICQHERALVAKSRIYNRYKYKSFEHQQYSKRIDRFFSVLGGVPLMKHILKVVAEADLDVQIHFDFERETTHEIIIGTENSWGLVYPNGTIVIGAKNFEIAVRTLAHELTHLAVCITYANNFLPYRAEDSFADDTYYAAVKECFNKYSHDNVSDRIVPVVFIAYQNPNANVQLRNFLVETIVRVPELTVRYRNNSTQLQECRDFYPLLFEYFDTKVKPDLEKYDGKPQVAVKIFNKNFGRPYNFINLKSYRLNIKSSQIIITNAPKAASAEIRQRHSLTAEREILFISAKKFLTASSVYHELLTQLRNFKPKIVLDASKIDLSQIRTVFTYLSADINQQIFIILKRSQDLKGVDLSTFLGRNLETNTAYYFWNDFDDKTKERFLEGKSKFQMKASKNFHMQRKFLKRTLVHQITKKKFKRIPIEFFMKLADGEEKYEFKNISKHKLQISTVESLDEDKIIDSAKAFKYVLISSDAGTGKSQSLKIFREHLLTNDADSMVYNIELNKYVSMLSKITDDINFKEFFMNNFLSSDSEIERLLFEFIYEYKNIFIFFDGFDEISPILKDQVIKLMKSFDAKNGSQLWMTTRSHLELELCNALDVQSFYSIYPFEYDEQLEFLANYWKHKEMESENIQKLTKKIVEKIGNEEKDIEIFSFFCDPQVLTLFADACVVDGKVDEEFIENFTKHSIYQRHVTKEIEKWAKSEIGSKMNAKVQVKGSNFFDVHKFLALQRYCEDVEEKFDFYRDEAWTDEEVNRCGIVAIIAGVPIFKHESFKEYFVADFILENLTKSGKYLKEALKLLLKFLGDNEQYHVINMFISGGLKTMDSEKLSERKIEQIAKALRTIITTSPCCFLTIAMLQNYETLYEFLIKVFLKVTPSARFNHLHRELTAIYEVRKIEIPTEMYPEIMARYNMKMNSLIASSESNVEAKILRDNLDKMMFTLRMFAISPSAKSIASFLKAVFD